MQLFGDLDLDILSFVRISWLNWIDCVNRMDSKIKVSHVLNSNFQGRRLRGQKKRMVELIQADINKCNIANWKEKSKNRSD